MRPIPIALALAAAVSAAPRAAAAQESLVDEGTLVISRNGAPVGREAYRVVRAAAGGGQAYRATAIISFDSLRIALRLTTDSAGGPLTYEAEVRTGTVLAAHVDGSGRPGRFSALTKTPHGEAARDYVVGPNPLLLDDDAFDPYFFAALPPCAPNSRLSTRAPVRRLHSDSKSGARKPSGSAAVRRARGTSR